MKTFLSLMIVVALFCGATDTLTFSFQNKQIVMEGGIQKKFYHPYMQLAMRYVSNFLILIVYVLQIKLKGESFGKKEGVQFDIENENQKKIQKIKNEQKEENNQTRSKLDYLLIILPTFLDVLANLGYYIALNFISASVYQMLRGGILITTYFLSYVFLHTKFTKYRSVGCLIILIGLLLIGLVNLIYSIQTQSQQQYTLIGYGLILISIIINAFHFIYEEHLAVHYKFEPFLIIGMQGVYGIIMALIYIPIFSSISCFFKQDACVIDDSGTALVQNFHIWLREITTNPVLLITAILVLFSMATYNAFGVAIAKYARSLTRSTIDVSRSVIIWIVGIIFTITLGANNNQYKFQSLVPQQIIGQVIGFLILVFGNMIYYEVLKFQFLEQQKSNSLLQEGAA